MARPAAFNLASLNLARWRLGNRTSVEIPATGWTPAELWAGGTYLGDYWNFSDASTLNEAHTNDAATPTDGAVVGYAAGLVNGRNCTQSNTASKPTFEVGVGKRSGIVIRDGAQFTAALGGIMPDTSPHCAFLSMRRSASHQALSDPRMFYFGVGASRLTKLSTRGVGTNLEYGARVRDTLDAPYSAADGATNPFTIGVSYDGAAGLLWKADGTSAAATTGTATADPDFFTFGRAIASSPRPLVCEAIVINRMPTADEIAEIYAYFARPL